MLVTKYGRSEIAFGGDVLKIGPPNFKCMFLSRLEAGMTVQYSELRGPGEHIVKWTNIGTTESSREFSRNIFSIKHHMHCLAVLATSCCKSCSWKTWRARFRTRAWLHLLSACC